MLQNKGTRYFIEIDLTTLKVTKCCHEQKENLDNGHQTNPLVHRLFVTEGQYNKMVSRCASELASIIET